VTNGRNAWMTAALGVVALWLLVWWATGPIGLTAWRIDEMGSVNAGARAGPPQVVTGHLDKPTLPALVHLLLRIGRTQDLHEPAGRTEKGFLWFLAFDALTALGLSGALLRWRHDHAPAQRLARALAWFAVALACFLVNGQAGLRHDMFAWPSWPRLGLDIAATLALGRSLIGLDQFFSDYPVKLVDWHVLASVRLRRGQPTSGRHGNLLSLARLIPRLITGVLLFGTVAATLPYLLFTIRYPLTSKPDGAQSTWPERLDLAALSAGTFSSLLALVLIVAFGWLMAASLLARLRAARENCTPDERRQSDWLFAGGCGVALMIAVFSAGLLLQFYYLAWGNNPWIRVHGGSVIALFFPTGWALILLALGGAVFLARTFGAQPLIKRTLLVTAVGLGLSVMLAMVQHLVTTRILRHATTVLQNGVSTLLAGSAAGVSLGLFRTRLERGIDGFLHRFMPATVIAEGKRRDLAIVFSDLGGYTALAAAEEAQALHLAGHFQKSAAEVTRRSGGRIVKTIGDAVLWVFSTPSEALHAALELPQVFAQAAQAAGLPMLPVNSGVHFGSVVEARDGDVYGAAVNLAARLQGVAANGGVVTSSEAMLEVRGGYRFESLGRLELKNVPAKIACFRVERTE
jgi:class 3 adenylate cyclase